MDAREMMTEALVQGTWKNHSLKDLKWMEAIVRREYLFRRYRGVIAAPIPALLFSQIKPKLEKLSIFIVEKMDYDTCDAELCDLEFLLGLDHGEY